MSDASANGNDVDPLFTITAWRDRCRRYGRKGNATTIDTLTLAISEIECLRQRLTAKQERRLLERIAIGARGRALAPRDVTPTLPVGGTCRSAPPSDPVLLGSRPVWGYRTT